MLEGESDGILNVPEITMKRALQLTVPDKEKTKVLSAIDAHKEIIVFGSNLSLVTEYGVALANAWSLCYPAKNTAVFSAPDWGRYARTNRGPCAAYKESFKDFIQLPALLFIVGLSYVHTARSRQQIDTALHRRATAGKPTIIAGWNMPPHDFKFDPGIEMADATSSEYPMLHGRTGLLERVTFTDIEVLRGNK